MLLDDEQIALLAHCRRILADGAGSLPPLNAEPVTLELRNVLERTAVRLQDNFPYGHPFYLGQMLRPPHPVALLAAMLAMTVNPNNHAYDGGRATSKMEVDAVSRLAEMFGWKKHLGHLCSGGTVANFEALWVARELASGMGIAASEQAHYTHARLSRVLQVPFYEVPCDTQGRMNLAVLEDLLQNNRIGTVVATLGTTGLGAVDPLDELVRLRSRYSFRLHVDAAYGGYFTLIDELPSRTRNAFQALSAADSIVVDPHKHGLQPYGCGCVLFQDRSVASVYHHSSPYTYFTSEDLHLGEISLECSRAGAAAAALWATLELFPLTRTGRFAADLANCRQAAVQFADWIRRHQAWQLVVEPELDIVVWMFRSKTSSTASRAARRFFEKAERESLHLALFKADRSLVEPLDTIETWDDETVTCLRACLLKPEHLEWMPELCRRLQAVLENDSDSSGITTFP